MMATCGRFVERFAMQTRGNFAVAASLVAVPVIMGLALAVDFPRIEHAARTASATLSTAILLAVSPDGEFDADLAERLYLASLDLPDGNASSSPQFVRKPDGTLSARVTTTTELTLGGIVLPEIFYRPVTVTVRDGKKSR